MCLLRPALAVVASCMLMFIYTYRTVPVEEMPPWFVLDQPASHTSIPSVSVSTGAMGHSQIVPNEFWGNDKGNPAIRSWTQEHFRRAYSPPPSRPKRTVMKENDF